MKTIAFEISLRQTTHGYFFTVSLDAAPEGEEGTTHNKITILEGPFPYATPREAEKAAQAHIALFGQHPAVVPAPGALLPADGAAGTAANTSATAPFPASVALTDLALVSLEVVFTESLEVEGGWGLEFLLCYDKTLIRRRASLGAFPVDELAALVDMGLSVLKEDLLTEAPSLAVPEVWEPAVTFTAPAKLKPFLPSLFGE